MHYYHFSDALKATQVRKKRKDAVLFYLQHVLFGAFLYAVPSHSSCSRQLFVAQHTPPSWEQGPIAPLRKQSFPILLESEWGTLPLALGAGLD